MKSIILLFFLIPLISMAQEFSPTLKLQYYAGACNAMQVALLLKNDSTFSFYENTGTTPLHTAIGRYLSSNNTGNLKSCSECMLTIQTILRDERYDYKKAPSFITDLMLVLMNGKHSNSSSLTISGYHNLLFMMLNELEKKPDFDFNYTLNMYGISSPGNAIGALASEGLSSTFCMLLGRYPDLRYNLDKRKNQQYYTPLMLAIQYNNIEMVKSLCFNGVDYYIKVEGFDNFPADEYARQLSRDEIVSFLNKRRLGREPASAEFSNCFQ